MGTIPTLTDAAGESLRPGRYLYIDKSPYGENYILTVIRTDGKLWAGFRDGNFVGVEAFSDGQLSRLEE